MISQNVMTRNMMYRMWRRRVQGRHRHCMHLCDEAPGGRALQGRRWVQGC